MVDKIKSVDAATSAKQVKEIEEKEAKKAEAVKKEEKTNETKKTDSFQTSSSALADYQIESYVADYINRLIKKYDGYDDIISRLRSFLGNFDIDEFRKDYPDVKGNSDLATAMYNETSKFLY